MFWQKMRSGCPEMRSGYPEMRSGYPEMRSGSPEIRSGHREMRSGSPEMRSGYREMRSGSREMCSDYLEMCSGCPEMRSGCPEMRLRDPEMSSCNSSKDRISFAIPHRRGLRFSPGRLGECAYSTTLKSRLTLGSGIISTGVSDRTSILVILSFTLTFSILSPESLLISSSILNSYSFDCFCSI